MDRKAVYDQLKIDEGVKYEIYLDHLGLPTFGVGHLVLDSDPENDQPVGTEVNEDRVQTCFELDLDIAIDECRLLYEDDWETFPGEVQEVLVNMMFNMGRPRLSGFVKFNAALRGGDWVEAAKEGRDSRWYNQVTNRAERLMVRLEHLASLDR